MFENYLLVNWHIVKLRTPKLGMFALTVSAFHGLKLIQICLLFVSDALEKLFVHIFSL